MSKENNFTITPKEVKVIATQATAEVFWMAFRALSKKEREAVVEKLLEDREFREDLIDMVILEQREQESSRSLDEYLADRGKREVNGL
jgi:hypothetical protein